MKSTLLIRRQYYAGVNNGRKISIPWLPLHLLQKLIAGTAPRQTVVEHETIDLMLLHQCQSGVCVTGRSNFNFWGFDQFCDAQLLRWIVLQDQYTSEWLFDKTLQGDDNLLDLFGCHRLGTESDTPHFQRALAFVAGGNSGDRDMARARIRLKAI